VSEPHLYALSVLAMRETGSGDTQISTRTTAVLLIDIDDTRQELQRYIRTIYPEADGWTRYSVERMEIPQNMAFGALRLTWQVEEAAK
jgi:hypothetical protein